MDTIYARQYDDRQGSYHYYSSDQRVCVWLAEGEFTILDVAKGDDYRHYLTRRRM